ncbi:MAG: hypothetical protein FWG14_11170 [Peptococcaceae bacterium]|nr:hypothetical protein [Peptococcaceae bacterium]
MRKLRFTVAYALIFLLLSVVLTGCSPFLNSNTTSPSDTETVSTPEDTVKKYKSGTLTQTSYASDYLDLKFTAPKGYTMKTEEELKELSKAAVQETGQLSGTGSGESVKEMQATSPNGYPTLTLSIEKGQKAATVEEFLNRIKTRDGSTTSLGNSSDDPITTVELAGYSYKKLSFSTRVTTAQGRVVMQDCLARECDEGIVLLTILYTSTTKGHMDTMMKGFTKFSAS